jgi:hypothetical protein
MPTRDSDDKVPVQDSTDDAYIHDVVGKKSDTIAGTSLVSATKRIEAASGGTLGADVTAIKAVTDVLPDAGALTTLAGEVTAIKAVTDVLPDAGALTDLLAAITPDEVDDSFSYLDAGAEQTIFEIVAATEDKSFISGITLDLTTLTQNGTIKAYQKINGGAYKQIGADIAWAAATVPKGLIIGSQYNLTGDFKLTYTEGGDEAADRAIPYSYVLHN